MSSSGTHLPFSVPADHVMQDLRVKDSGLSEAEARLRLTKFGPNVLPSQKGANFAVIFIKQFLNPLIYLLIVIAIISFVSSHESDALFVLIVLLINAFIGSYQEYSAEKNASALKNLAKTFARVRREGKIFELEASELVPGDLVLLESGAKVPADLRLISSQGLSVDESLLTGESVPSEKSHAVVLDPRTALGDQLNMAFAGTLVSRGIGSGVVTSTALNTQLGQIAKTLLRKSVSQTPLLVRMEHFTSRLAKSLVLVMALIAIALLLKGEPWINVLMVSVALGVSAIPEGLPISLTVALSIASRKMARRNVIVRQLSAVEALGSCTVIATDKTGTLTANELTVRRAALPDGTIYSVGGRGVEPKGELETQGPKPKHEMDSYLDRLAEACAISNDSFLRSTGNEWEASGDPVDIALLVFAKKIGADENPLALRQSRVAEIPYASEHGFAAAMHFHAGQNRIAAKGAHEKIFPMCTQILSPDGLLPFRQEDMEAIAHRLAAEGYKVLAVATKEVSADHPMKQSEMRGFTLVGLVGLQDPLREDAATSVRKCQEAGIRVAMITGDHPATALAISRELGLAQKSEEVVTGQMLREAHQPEAIDDLVRKGLVFARVEPKQKLEIVQSLHRLGHFVAVTGDGANDAPALKVANVGVAMGKRGTDVAKETASLIIADDKFSSLVSGVEEGRIAYANVRKVIYLLISTGGGEIVLFLLSLIAGLPMPLTAVQLLWLNLVTEGIQDKALAFEPGDGNELKRPPRSPQEAIFDKLMIRRVLLSAILIGTLSFITYGSLLNMGSSHSAAQNLTLLLMVLFENMLIANARSERNSFFKINPLSNPILLLGTIGAQLVHIWAMHTPFMQKLLGVQPVSLNEWLAMLGVAFTLVIAMEVDRIFYGKAEQGKKRRVRESY